MPVGLGAGELVKLGKLPVKIQLQWQYSVIHPDGCGQHWNFQLQVTPVIPNLRDVGGYKTRDGGTVVRGLYFTGQSLRIYHRR